MLYTIGMDSYNEYLKTSPAELDSEGWEPECEFVHEFSVAPLSGGGHTRVSTIDDGVEAIFAMGFGPCPFYRRPGVLVYAREDHTSGPDDDEDDSGVGNGPR